ncbi:MAG TPA: trypsin-like serine protease [Kofleriaceae bacterium]|nr:trypsin-like serine protease [Kofleriaceae bacterium]
MRTGSSALCAILLGAALITGAAACASEDPGDPGDPGDPDLGSTAAEIIGGFPVDSAELNAIGALGADLGEGVVPFCTGTLIAPTRVLTAKHCVLAVPDGTPITFLIGPDARAPVRAVPVRGTAVEPTVSGGLQGLGSDVAIVHLAEAVTDVAPLPVAALTDEQIGSRMIGVGYGVQNAKQDFGTRRAGSMTLKATGGPVFAAVFGSFERFLEAGAPRLFPTLDPAKPEDLAVLRQIYDELRLLDGIEAWFGSGPGDAQACNGDSGGPIAQRVGTQTTVFGVTSWGFHQDDGTCALDGASYASMNPTSLDFIDYEAHCPLIPRAGTCDGATVAVRCASPDEGGRRELRTDCAELGQICGAGPDGTVGCVDAPRE